jgi:protein NrfC
METSFSEAQGYLFFDPHKCAGCKSCMLACALVHEGTHSLSFARIQILDNPFGQYPTDLQIAVCRQCKYPLCVEACPVGALYVDKDHMNVRTVDKEKCIGCQLCITACPFTPSLIVWNPETNTAMKCDLCTNTVNRDESGNLACVEVCPTRALKFSPTQPKTAGYRGYIVNLRGEGWKRMGFSAETEAEQ